MKATKTTATSTMETGLYVRVSTEEQAQEGFSIRGQEQKLKEFAKIKDWSIYKVYVDEGISGKNITERPAIQELIADIKAGHIQNVLVFKIDRLTRSTSDLLYLVELFNEHDCAFNSLMESIDTQTASGRMFLKIIGIFAEFERENIIERVKLGIERKVKEGYTLAGGHISYGYDKEKGEKEMTVNETEAQIVREIFDMYVNQGMPQIAIARRLIVQGVPTKDNKTWMHTTVKAILKNCTYIGRVRHKIHDPENGYSMEGRHEAIISEELFGEAQRLLQENARISPTKRPKDEVFFSGILHCAKCKGKMLTHDPKGRPGSRGYKCKYKTYKTCDASSMSHAKLEQAFLDYISRINTFSEADSLELQKQEQEKQQNEQLIQAYQEKLRQFERKEKEMLHLYVNNDIDFDTYKAMRKEIGKDRASIQADLARLDIPEEAEPTIKRENIITQLKENWQWLSNAEKRQFLVRFVKVIYAVNEIPEGEMFGNVKVVDVEFQTN